MKYNQTVTQLIGLCPEEFQATIISEMKAEILQLFKSFTPTESTSEYLTRKEASKILKVTLVTLSNWDKKGVLQPYRIGNAIRYKREEIESALQALC